MRHCLAVSCAAMLICWGFSTSAHAQSMPWINPDVLSTTAGTDVMSTVLADRGPVVDQTDPADSLSDSELPLSGRAGSVSYSYRSSPSRTRQNFQTFLSRAPDAAARAELEKMIASQPTLMDDIRDSIAPYGLDSHDVADAYTMWWINAWLVANKRDENPDRGTIAMVKNQVRTAFATTPDFAKASDAQRQEFAEALLLQATMLGSMFEQWKNDPKMLDQLADAARKGAEASGLDLSMMTLTRNGFVPREGADSSGAVAGEDPIRNARADAPTEEGESSGLGIALAAGAGLGATLLGGLAWTRRG